MSIAKQLPHLSIIAGGQSDDQARKGLPSPPAAVARLVAAQGSQLLYPKTGGYREVEFWYPPAVDESTLEAVKAYLKLIDGFLEPADRAALLNRVLALISHYRTDSNPPQVEMMIADDWAEDLGEFPLWVIEDAARQWRRTKKFRPQISEIRELCEYIVAKERKVQKRLRQIVRTRPSDTKMEIAIRDVARNTFGRCFHP
jgi:hypothetical protein